MERRVLLRIAVKLALLAGAGAFAGVFLHGLLGPGPAPADVVELGGIPPGAGRLAAWEGRAVWVVNRSDDQLAGLPALSGHVVRPGAPKGPFDASSRSRRPAWGVYLAETRRDGILVQYSRGRPAGLPAGVPWHGGFVDPGSGAVFDVAGRRYRGTPGVPLAVPPHRFTGNGTVVLGEW